MKFTNEAKIGFIAIVALGMLIWGISFLKGKNLFSDTTSYYALYPKIEGISESTPVLINGFKIGQVNSTRLLQNQNNQILLKFDIQKDYQLPLSTVAQIKSTDLLGGKAITLIFPENVSTYHEPGDTLPSDFDEGISALTAQLESNADEIITSVDSILFAINSLLNVETRAHIKQTIAGINTATQQINNELSDGGDIKKTIRHLSAITAGLAENMPAIDSTLNRVAALTESISPEEIDSISKNLTQTIEQTNKLIADINSGTGTVGQLMRNDTLYFHLSSAVAHLDSLFIDLEKNPKRYVHFSLFGKKDK